MQSHVFFSPTRGRGANILGPATGRSRCPPSTLFPLPFTSPPPASPNPTFSPPDTLLPSLSHPYCLTMRCPGLSTITTKHNIAERRRSLRLLSSSVFLSRTGFWLEGFSFMPSRSRDEVQLSGGWVLEWGGPGRGLGGWRSDIHDQNVTQSLVIMCGFPSHSHFTTAQLYPLGLGPPGFTVSSVS